MTGKALRKAGWAAVLLASSWGCGGNKDGDGRFQTVSTRQAVSNTAFVNVDGRYIGYLASEAGSGPNGTDFNGDGDFNDSIAVVVDMLTGVMRELDVAAAQIVFLGDQTFLVVSEDQDGTDWDLDGTLDDLVLIHWTRFNPLALTFVATLNDRGRTHVVEIADRLYFSEVPVLPLVAPDTTLSFVSEAMPTTVVRIQNADLANTLDPSVLGEDEGMLFLFQDETFEGRDLNGDGDSVDEAVLALLDSTDPAAPVRNVGLALEDDRIPVRARNTAPGDWLVAFLVSEQAQGQTNLNAPGTLPAGWQPPQCAGLDDVDAFDDVLHFLHFAAWSANPGANPPVNTGLAGRDRVLAVRGTGGSPGFVATLCFEEDDGTCSLNLDFSEFDPDDGPDMDQDDAMVRWVEALPLPLPPGDTRQLIACSLAAGGLLGVSDFGDRFIGIFDEEGDGRDHDDNENSTILNLLAVLDPGRGPMVRWNFDQSSTVETFVGSNWMREDRVNGRLLLTMQENVENIPLNTGDIDTFDSVPALGFFDPVDSDDLDLPGPPVATQFGNADIALGGDWVFFRGSEAQDGRRWNPDGDMFDIVLLRARRDRLDQVSYVVTLENNPDGSQIARFHMGGDVGLAYIANEQRDRVDYNNDGDRTDFVLRWFRF